MTPIEVTITITARSEDDTVRPWASNVRRGDSVDAGPSGRVGWHFSLELAVDAALADARELLQSQIDERVRYGHD